MGQVIVEAMLAGLPVVASDAGGIPEVVGDTALLVNPGDLGGLTDALRTLMQDPAMARELGERAARRVRARFNWAGIVGEHEAVYRAALRSVTT